MSSDNHCIYQFWGCYVLVTLLLSSTACKVGPSYHPPAVELPVEWKAPHSDSSDGAALQPAPDCWWTLFHDETLNQLECEVIAYNPTLYTALQRLLQSRAQARIRRADLSPQITLNPNYLDMGSLFKLFIPPTVGPISTSGGSVFRVHQFQYNIPLNLSYELDLWGRLKQEYDAARLDADAERAALQTTWLSLTTDLASSYFLLRSLDGQILFLEKTLLEYNSAYLLASSRFNKGIANQIDVVQASVQISNVESELFDLRRQRSLQEDTIAFLVGRAPAELHIESMPLFGTPPTIPPGAPATVLMQRPDVARAERTMASEHALIGAAYASLLPSIQLVGTIGVSSPTLRDFLKWISRLWSFGVNIDQSVYDGGRIDGSIDLAWARFKEAKGEYKTLVITAFREVEDALNNLDMQAKQAGSLADASTSAQKAAVLSINRYKNGLTSYLEVVDSQKGYLDAERQLIALQGVRYLSTVQLIKAIGGGW